MRGHRHQEEKPQLQLIELRLQEDKQQLQMKAQRLQEEKHQLRAELKEAISKEKASFYAVY